jgi:hypothetical protein
MPFRLQSKITYANTITTIAGVRSRRRRLGYLASSVAALLCLFGGGSAHAAAFTVTNTNTSGAGSLAQAITDANANGSAVTDTISFAITPLGGVKTIAMGGTALPQITTPVTIDGYTQSGASANTKALSGGDDAVLTVEITADHNGIDLAASNSTIRGLAINRGATPSGGANSAILIDGSNNTIVGNFIGLNPAGANPIAAPGNETYLDGIELAGGNTGNTFGGPNPADRNVISGRVGEDIRLANDYPATGSTNTTIQNNYLGTNPAGTGKAAPNEYSDDGIRVFDGNTGTTIKGNLISGTNQGGVGGVGIWVSGTSRAAGDPNGPTTTSSGTIEGNLIGTQRDGTSALPNTTGIYIGDARTWVVGGTNAGQPNTIAFNTVEGVEVSGPNNLDLGGDRNRITENSIYGNGSLGIDLAQNGQIGRTPNDVSSNPAVQDNDAGPNEQQNFPVLSSASVAGGLAIVSGSLPSRPSTAYRIEVFSSGGSCAANTAGQGQTYLGFIDVQTDASGNASFNAVPFNGVPAGQTVIAATATDPNGNTSEFSDCIAGSSSPPPAQCSDGVDNDGDGKIDYPNDPGCTDAQDNTESPDPSTPPPAAQCSDGVDNDGDGKVDFPDDPGCTSAGDTTESPDPSTPAQCSDGIDNDGDGKVDFPADPGCASAGDDSESPDPSTQSSPQARTDAASGVTFKRAVLHGTVNAEGQPTTYFFDYGTSTKYGSRTPDGDAGSDSTDHGVAANIAGLKPNTTYHFRVVAQSSAGTVNGQDRAFKTPKLTPPSARTKSATGVTRHAAILHGSVNPHGRSTTYYFEWGTSTHYGHLTSSANAGSGSSARSVAAGITGLKANTLYHFRVVARNGAGRAAGHDLTFKTPAAPRRQPRGCDRDNDDHERGKAQAGVNDCDPPRRDERAGIALAR